MFTQIDIKKNIKILLKLSSFILVEFKMIGKTFMIGKSKIIREYMLYSKHIV